MLDEAYKGGRVIGMLYGSSSTGRLVCSPNATIQMPVSTTELWPAGSVREVEDLCQQALIEGDSFFE